MEPEGYASVFPVEICSWWICILQEIRVSLIWCVDSYCLLFRTAKRLILYCTAAEEQRTRTETAWPGNPYSGFPHGCLVIWINKTTKHWMIVRKSRARLGTVKISTHRCSIDFGPGLLSQVAHLFWVRNVKLQNCLCTGQVQYKQWQKKRFCTTP